MPVATHMRVIVRVLMAAQVLVVALELVAAHMTVAAQLLTNLAFGFKSIIVRCKWFLAAFKRMPQKV